MTNYTSKMEAMVNMGLRITIHPSDKDYACIAYMPTDNVWFIKPTIEQAVNAVFDCVQDKITTKEWTLN